MLDENFANHTARNRRSVVEGERKRWAAVSLHATV